MKSEEETERDQWYQDADYECGPPGLLAHGEVLDGAPRRHCSYEGIHQIR